MTDNVIVHDINVDHELTSPTDADPWDDDGERSEVTGTAGQLTWGRPADKHYAAAHAVGAALRELRRQGRPTAEPPEERAKWLGPEFDYEATLLAIRNGDKVDYWDGLEVMKIRTKGLDKLPPRPDIDVWREPPGYPGYVLNSVSRELWRSPREVTLPSGNVRRYGGKKVTARNGSFSLTVNGVTSSRGVNSLYRDTFPEFSKKRKKKPVGEWVDAIKTRDELGRCGNEGVAEWLAGGMAGVVTRPK